MENVSDKEIVKKKKSKSSSSDNVRRKSKSGRSKSASSSKNRKSRASSSKIERKKKNSEGFKHRKVLGAIGDILFYLIVLIVIAGAGFIYLGDKNSNIMGYRMMTVLTNSMEQNDKSGYDNGFSQGSLIILKNEDPYEMKEGDIITFNPVRENSHVFLTHRIINIDEELREKRETFITTKGDANTGADVPIRASQVTGKVVKSIPQAGYVLSFVKKNVVVVAILISTSFGIIATLKYARNLE